MTSATTHPSTLEFISSIAVDISPAAFQQLRTMLLERKNFALDTYKDKCVRRRISIRIRATRCKTAEEYCELLQRDEAELDRLLRVLTIHVSQFFRNFSMFEKLRGEILPGLFMRCSPEKPGPVRILSIGCASGEEPYSVAIILRESFAAELATCGATITGIDIDPHTLADARTALYGEDRLKELPPPALARFFSPLDHKYLLAEEVKELVDFRQGDMVSDPLPAADLILCRNVLIYLERSRQERLLGVFAQALGASGVLVLGKSETLAGESRKRYRAICPVERIYSVLPPREGVIRQGY